MSTKSLLKELENTMSTPHATQMGFWNRLGWKVVNTVVHWDGVLKIIAVPLAMLFFVVAFPLWSAAVYAQDMRYVVWAFLISFPGLYLYFWPSQKSLSDKYDYYVICIRYTLGYAVSILLSATVHRAIPEGTLMLSILLITAYVCIYATWGWIADKLTQKMDIYQKFYSYQQ